LKRTPTRFCRRASPAPTAAASGFTKEEDTLDGWFDSGSTHFAAMQKDQGFWPATMYLEGLDQYRGWFQSSLLTAVGALGKGAPFKECVTHGWTVDGEGKAMHKSLGNGISPDEIINEYGADMLRLWAGSADYHVDVRCSKEIFKQLGQNYLKFRNTARYCLGNLDGFNADELVSAEDMLELDRWAVTKLNALDRKVARRPTTTTNSCGVPRRQRFLRGGAVQLLSGHHQGRLYCEEKDGLKRRSAQTALFLILDTLTKMFAPILAFTCDEIWQAMPHRSEDDARNVVLNDMNKPFADYALNDRTMEKWDVIQRLRDDVNAVLETARADKKIGKSLEAHVSLHADDDDTAKALMSTMGVSLSEALIVSDCTIVNTDPAADAVTGKGTNFPGLTVEVTPAAGAKCERCWMQSPTVGPTPTTRRSAPAAPPWWQSCPSSKAAFGRWFYV
jgi:isoleucyl-tRNA synthetase